MKLRDLKAKRAALNKVLQKLASLNKDLKAKKKKKKVCVVNLSTLKSPTILAFQELEVSIEICSQKLVRAEKLINGLGGERERWTQAAESLGNDLHNVVGDVLLSSGIIAYLGAFTVEFRQVT